jgi:hypothetical protein
VSSKFQLENQLIVYRILAVLTIKNKEVSESFEYYRDHLESPNIKRVWHCTKLVCEVQKTTKLCKLENCSVCGILRRGIFFKLKVLKNEGFQLKHSGLNITFQRFGKGIYFAPNSSKANDYTDAIRAMFLCKVAAGREYITQEDQSTLTAPPPGYDSVYGEPGQRLNYPELVIYDQRGVKVTHLVLYSI